MVFSSISFLFLFLPIVLCLYHLLFLPVATGRDSAGQWRHAGNFFLLAASLVFFFWGEGWRVWILIASTAANYFCGLLIGGLFHTGRIEQLPPHGRRTRWQRAGLLLSVCANLAFLGFFKYFNFGVDTLNALLPEAWRLEDVIRITLPLGISFYTFQAMSYTIDVYRGEVRATRNLVDFACYVTLFPQLVAGPIVRYRDIAEQLVRRCGGRALFASGVNRFLIGLSKKVLIANTVANASDRILELSADQVTTPLAWIFVVCFTLQIYFDFSGYSDMAIGLGRMFGFEFRENFNYPYVARSVQDFWRRWHLSLSTWFRDYLYIPLGGNRAGAARSYRNLLIVFFLCGLWHGANWAFVAWGLLHGFFLILERTGFGSWLQRRPRPLQHVYALAIVMAGWVLFATESFDDSLVILAALAGFAPSEAPLDAATYFSRDIRWAIVAGVLFSAPVAPALRDLLEKREATAAALALLRPVVLLALLFACGMALASGTHNPFIYFRF